MPTTQTAELVEQVLTRMLWSRRAATIARTLAPVWMFGSRAALAALIADHDQTFPAAPAEGDQRVASIVAHVLRTADDAAQARATHRTWVLAGRPGPEPVDPYRCPVAGINARTRGLPDPQLLARASDVLTYLHTFTFPPEPGHTTAGLIRVLRAARSAEDTPDAGDVDELDLP